MTIVSEFIDKLNRGEIRSDFPVLQQRVNDNPLVYFDNAATTQKPQLVIDAITQYYAHNNSNVHRGVHTLSMRATQLYEAAREKVRRFINAPHTQECIFVRGTTEAINLVAQSFVAPRILPGEEVVVTYMEHHSNIVPWQIACKKAGATLRAVPITVEGEIDMVSYANTLSDKTAFVAITYVSNVLGTINPIKKMIEMAHAHNAVVLVDGAQAVPHISIDVQDLGCDFFAFSGHKMYAPTGIGVLWGREKLLDSMPPYQGGGEMIKYVSFASTEYAGLPFRFEAGTPNISGAIGLSAAIDYLWSLDLDIISAYEAYLLEYTTNALKTVKGYNLMGTSEHKAPVISFVHGKIHPHDIGTILDTEGVAIRTGHHCAMPLMDFFEVPATCRVSLSFYNTTAEVDHFISLLHKVKEVLG
jgi:cysteine desulfurase/selenocysteine lyase